jgi:hypothetical protein
VSQGSRAALILAAIAVLVGGFILANGSGDDNKSSSTAQATTATTPNDFPPPPGTTTTPTAPPVTTIRIVGGKPQGGVAKLEFKKGDTIRFRVVSDVSDEIHVHGYDLMKDVKAGGSVTFDFSAKIDGRFVVELEGAGEEIAQLEVTP